MHRQSILAILIFVFIFTSFVRAQKRAGKPDPLCNSKDMVLVHGNDSMGSFYISRYEVCNKDYRTYLIWLLNAYGTDYPEVFQQALPDTTVIPGYFNNPAYAYYPVVGVSWEQAVKYCNWLTDRYNEFIMIREGLLYFDPTGMNSNIFNTEAYLAEQYEGAVKTMYKDPKSGESRKIRYEDDILVPAFRLPTVAEWKFASNPANNATVEAGEVLKSSDPYGSKYFLDTWYDFYTEMDKESAKNPYEGYIPPVISTYSGKGIEISGLLLKPVYGMPGETGIRNLENNVSEWVINRKDNATNQSGDLLLSYKNSGFKTQLMNCCLVPVGPSKIERNANGRILSYTTIDTDTTGYYVENLRDSSGVVLAKTESMVEKDSLGTMRYKVVSMLPNGDFIAVYDYKNKPAVDPFIWSMEHSEPQPGPERLILGGDYTKPGLQNESSLPENFRSKLVGFRVVMSK